jgi:hypothetical protein
MNTLTNCSHHYVTVPTVHSHLPHHAQEIRCQKTELHAWNWYLKLTVSLLVTMKKLFYNYHEKTRRTNDDHAGKKLQKYAIRESVFDLADKTATNN